jgi:hypothetical protein
MESQIQAQILRHPQNKLYCVMQKSSIVKALDTQKSIIT